MIGFLKDWIGFLKDLIGFLKDWIGFLKDLIGFLRDLIGPMDLWGPKGAHGTQKLRSRPGTRVPAAFGPHGLGPMGPWVHGPYQILKETYQILKETYPILKETYQILGRKIGRKIGKGEAKVTMGVVWTRGVLNFRKIL